ncbi:ExbD/TolR family protein [Limisphaera sp. VF-2]|jgi:biopolymer transport protein ExbD|uniref:ExbD/TolR family protein n=1 Tax=Limisphaera sp. VF-2 TaxID=3400418 RepID=UPI00174FFBB0|nr:biopolymer transporter ExbD [Limisphaera sp.]
MRFQVTVRAFQSPWEPAAWVGTFLLVVMFVLLVPLVSTPGVRVELPIADDLPGVEGPVLAVAVDQYSRFYFQNQLVDEPTLRSRLAEEAKRFPAPPPLLVQADRRTPYETLVRLTVLARQAGLTRAVMATLPATGIGMPGNRAAEVLR